MDLLTLTLLILFRFYCMHSMLNKIRKVCSPKKFFVIIITASFLGILYTGTLLFLQNDGDKVESVPDLPPPPECNHKRLVCCYYGAL